MKFEFDSSNWKEYSQGEANCFLLANGLGGFCSLTHLGSVARGDQALLMAAKKAPNVRWNIITNLYEKIYINGEGFELSSQIFKNSGNVFNNLNYLKSFEFDIFPKWTYQIEDVIIEKKIVLVYQENTVAVAYKVYNPNSKDIKLSVIPLFRDTPKNDEFDINKKYVFSYTNNSLKFSKTDIFYFGNYSDINKNQKIIGPIYFSQDERDGRNETGFVISEPEFIFNLNNEENEFVLGFSLNSKYDNTSDISLLFKNESDRQEEIQRTAALKSDLAKKLLQASDVYLVNRDSINGKSIIAGYPFFEDWGRDTMISLPGICLVSKRFKECKQILETFAKYEKNGLLPNLFPEGDQNPMYNSVDAPLLFINTIYEYVKESGDTEFINEMYPVMKDIMDHYMNGTDFHIKMDEDCLIMAGADLEQLTWMDVRVNCFLPTPRHGKPVEINAYWYSACKVMEEFSQNNDDKKMYKELSLKIKNSFLDNFWNKEDECLKDVLSNDYQENQIRPNQIWSLTLPFTIPSVEMEEKIISKVREELYTSVGLRTLSTKDKNFHPIYIGPMEERDRAYHQGTVWTFPLGAYYRACIRYISKTNNQELYNHVKSGIEELEFWLKEGCTGQLAEIYDGLKPTVSRGCFAQAWSVGEILRAVVEFDNL